MSALGQANAFLGNVVKLAFLGLAGGASWLGWKVWHADAEHAKEVHRLEQQIHEKQQEVERLGLALKLMKVERRVARVVVLEQTPAKPGGRVTTKARFEEVDGAGNPIGVPKEITIDGDVLYVDAWVVKFEDVFVEQGDPLRSASLVLFRRLFGEHQAPVDGVVVDQPGKRPAAYGGVEGEGGMSALETEVWNDFWEYANDPAKAAEIGIRAAHGEAPSERLVSGAVYTVTLRSSGGLTIQRERPSPDTR